MSSLAALAGVVANPAASWGQQSAASPAGVVVRRHADVDRAAHSGFAFVKDSKLEVLSDAGQGGEGPAWDPEWGILSTGEGGIHRRAVDGTQSLLRKDAGTNGLLFDPQGRLIACEPKQRRVTRMQRDGTLEVLTDAYEGKPYNQPNDVTLDSRGRIFFSDACYGGPQNIRQRTADGRSIEGVYRIDSAGKVERVLGVDDVERANGVLISADDKYLFVADNCNDRLGGARKLWRFRLRDDGRVDHHSRTLLYDWQEGRGPDGIKQDVEGNLYVAGGTNVAKPPYEPDNSRPGGIYVIHPESGQLLDFIAVPTDEVTNCAFGGEDGRDLYITGGGTLYRVRTNMAGRVLWPRR
jgi:gluconolactonase